MARQVPRPKVEVFELVANESDTNDQNVHDTFECECERMVQGYADMITSYYGGERGCADDGDDEEGSPFEEAFDIEYRTDADLRYRSVCFAVAVGGPGVYVDTQKEAVTLYWGSTEKTVYLPHRICEAIDSEAEEWFCAMGGGQR